MINLINAKEEFIKYTENFNLSNEKIKGKQEHSIRVMNLSTEIAKSLNLSKEEIELATLIGLLHDIARFKQYQEFKTFHDYESFDHGDKGVEILKENNFIRKFIEDSKYDEIIYKAIKNHNKFKIEDGLTEKEIMFSKIIRDADKIDIIYEATWMFYVGEEQEIENSYVSDKVFEQIYIKKLVERKKSLAIEGVNEIISVIAFVYDIYYQKSFSILYKNNYINKIIDRFDYKKHETKLKMNELKDLVNTYIKDKKGS